jgi:hypothetical protein
MPKVHFIRSSEGDWTAMYVDGQKVAEGHSLDDREVCKALGIKATSVEVDVDPYENQDKYFPEKLGA